MFCDLISFLSLKLAVNGNFFLKIMVSKKHYYSRFKNSYDEQVNSIRDLPVGQIRSHIEPKLLELNNDFEGNEMLVKVLIIGEIDKEFLKM